MFNSKYTLAKIYEFRITFSVYSENVSGIHSLTLPMWCVCLNINSSLINNFAAKVAE